jgi:hypothetical protein
LPAAQNRAHRYRQDLMKVVQCGIARGSSKPSQYSIKRSKTIPRAANHPRPGRIHRRKCLPRHFVPKKG